MKVWIAVGLVAVILAPMLVWGFGVATAGIFGRGEAHKIKESAVNRIVQQAAFEQQYADVLKFDQQIEDANRGIAEWDKANAGKQGNAIGTLAQQRAYLVQVRDGLVQQCQNTATAYSAGTRKYLAEDFKSADLPYEISLDKHCK